MRDNTSDDFETTVRSVIQLLHDGHWGFAGIGHHLRDRSVREFFLRESLIRQRFAGELEVELRRRGLRDVGNGGTPSGAVHRAWTEMKAGFGGGDQMLLEALEEGEVEVRKAYEQACGERSLPFTVRQLLSRQQEHILEVDRRIKNLRAGWAA